MMEATTCDECGETFEYQGVNLDGSPRAAPVVCPDCAFIGRD